MIKFLIYCRSYRKSPNKQINNNVIIIYNMTKRQNSPKLDNVIFMLINQQINIAIEETFVIGHNTFEK